MNEAFSSWPFSSITSFSKKELPMPEFDPAVDLSVHDQRVEHRPAVVGDHIALDLDIESIRVHLHDHRAASRHRSPRKEARSRRSASRPGSVPGSTAPREGLALTASSPSVMHWFGMSATRTMPSDSSSSSSGVSRILLRQFEDLPAHVRRRRVDGASGDGSAPAGKSPGAPVEDFGIAGDHEDILRIDAQSVRRRSGQTR